MFKIYLKLVLFLCILLSPGILLSQHHLYFSIPECPNAVNIQEIDNLSFTIAPVPASNYLELNIIESLSEDADITILDLSGKIVYKNSISAKHKIFIDVSSF